LTENAKTAPDINAVLGDTPVEGFFTKPCLVEGRRAALTAFPGSLQCLSVNRLNEPAPVSGTRCGYALSANYEYPQL
jgi:hypothetical protein